MPGRGHSPTVFVASRKHTSFLALPSVTQLRMKASSPGPQVPSPHPAGGRSGRGLPAGAKATQGLCVLRESFHNRKAKAQSRSPWKPVPVTLRGAEGAGEG